MNNVIEIIKKAELEEVKPEKITKITKNLIAFSHDEEDFDEDDDYPDDDDEEDEKADERRAEKRSRDPLG